MVRGLPKTSMDSMRGGDWVEPVTMARRSMKFSLTDQALASPRALRADSIASCSQVVASRVRSCSAAKARVSSGERFLGSQTSGGGRCCRRGRSC